MPDRKDTSRELVALLQFILVRTDLPGGPELRDRLLQVIDADHRISTLQAAVLIETQRNTELRGQVTELEDRLKRLATAVEKGLELTFRDIKQLQQHCDKATEERERIAAAVAGDST